MRYGDFILSKAFVVPATGMTEISPIHDRLFPFQKDLVRWALRRGRAACFASTGLGKSGIAIEWSKHTHAVTRKPSLILTPLAVASQFVAEGASLDCEVTKCIEASDIRDGINVANYERLHKFEDVDFGSIVLDESSILKDFTSATRNALITRFAVTPYRLACSATPAPNDFTELGNHAEFLGITTRTEMLSTFFVHDGGSTQDWRIKGHAKKDFWKWVCSWAALVRNPSDLGYEDGNYALPPLEYDEHVIKADQKHAYAAGRLFVEAAATLNDQRAARRATIDQRVEAAARIAAMYPDEPIVFWCDLNDESEALTAAIKGAVEVTGSQSLEEKEARLSRFASESNVRLVTKSSIAGWGMNWQHCHRTVFVGVSHSFEAWYQAIRRFWRFGQTLPVTCHIVISELEGRVMDNLRRKQMDAEIMAAEMSKYSAEFVRANVRSAMRETDAYNPQMRMTVPAWLRSEVA